jgi:hypothetical protein
MAGHRITLADGSAAYIDYADATGSAKVNGRIWRWEYHEFGGPLFLRADGSPRSCQFPRSKAVWKAFEKWSRKYEHSKLTPAQK